MTLRAIIHAAHMDTHTEDLRAIIGRWCLPGSGKHEIMQEMIDECEAHGVTTWGELPL